MGGWKKHILLNTPSVNFNDQYVKKSNTVLFSIKKHGVRNF